MTFGAKPNGWMLGAGAFVAGATFGFGSLISLTGTTLATTTALGAIAAR